jgi:hypothetical protein
MPVSDYHSIPAVLDEVYRLQPEDVLDLGVGFGKWGVLLREVLDAMYGRCAPGQWQREITGVEIHRKYLNPAWESYDCVEIMNFVDLVWNEHDLVLMMDSLEHLSPEVGRPFLAKLVANNRHVIVSVPNGPMPQGEVYGNPHEAHLWTFNGLEEFAPYEHTVLHQGLCTVVSIKGGLR